MATTRNEKEVLEYLNLPKLPLKEWDKKSSFKDGVAVTILKDDEKAYAVATFDNEIDDEPIIKKVFANEPFYGIEKILIVPDYMNTDIENADLDENSKKAAEALKEEVKELEDVIGQTGGGVEDKLPEWVFPEINNMEEAQAWLKSYNSRNKIRGRVPDNEETMKLRLISIYYDMQKKKK